MLNNGLYSAFMFCCVFCFLSTNAFAVPVVINYQGKLTDSAGTPVPDTNGPFAITFKIFDTATPSPGTETCLWGENQANVTTKSGIFNVLLGDGTSDSTCTGSLNDALDGSDRWLEMQIGTDSPMASRQRISSVGYAITAGKLENAVHVSGGDVGMPTVSPGNKLSVAGTIESTLGGIKFPDGTVQTTATSTSGLVKNYIGATSCHYNGALLQSNPRNDPLGTCAAEAAAQGVRYEKADNICAAAYGTGTRVCTNVDFALGKLPTNNSNPGSYTVDGRYNWFNSFGAQVGAYGNCEGWLADISNDGMTWLDHGMIADNCSASHPFACCK